MRSLKALFLVFVWEFYFQHSNPFHNVDRAFKFLIIAICNPLPSKRLVYVSPEKMKWRVLYCMIHPWFCRKDKTHNKSQFCVSHLLREMRILENTAFLLVLQQLKKPDWYYFQFTISSRIIEDSHSTLFYHRLLFSSLYKKIRHNSKIELNCTITKQWNQHKYLPSGSVFLIPILLVAL